MALITVLLLILLIEELERTELLTKAIKKPTIKKIRGKSSKINALRA